MAPAFVAMGKVRRHRLALVTTLFSFALLAVLSISGCGSPSASTASQTPVSTNSALGTTTLNPTTIPTSPSGAVPTPTIPAASSTPPKAGSLQPGVSGKIWTLTRFIASGQNYALVPNAPITLRMQTEGAIISGVATCNHYSGTYAASGTSLRVQIGSVTQVKCSDAAEALEHAYYDAVPHVQMYRITSGNLVLASTDGKFQLTFASN